MSRTLTPNQKEQILKRDNYSCVYCSGRADCVDHIVPFSLSQCDDSNNLVASCVECNLIGSDFVFENFESKKEYILYIKRGIEWANKIKRARHLPKEIYKKAPKRKLSIPKQPHIQVINIVGKVFARDNYQCQSCRKRLMIDRLICHPIIKEDGYNPKNLITLCNDCYEIIESNRIRTCFEILYYKKIKDDIEEKEPKIQVLERKWKK